MVHILFGRCTFATSECDLGVTFDLGSTRMFLLPHLLHISLITKLNGLLQLIIKFLFT